MNKRILVVEDEFIIALDLKLGLENLGYAVIDTVGTGQEAIDIAVENRPDVVIMDIKLKGDMDGIEAAEKIAELHIPVIYLTANTDDFTFNKANMKGSYGFLEKPFNLDKLDTVIKLTIQRSKIESKKLNIVQGFVNDDSQQENLV